MTYAETKYDINIQCCMNNRNSVRIILNQDPRLDESDVTTICFMALMLQYGIDSQYMEYVMDGLALLIEKVYQWQDQGREVQ